MEINSNASNYKLTSSKTFTTQIEIGNEFVSSLPYYTYGQITWEKMPSGLSLQYSQTWNKTEAKTTILGAHSSETPSCSFFIQKEKCI